MINNNNEPLTINISQPGILDVRKLLLLFNILTVKMEGGQEYPADSYYER
jgi:hypothetical protein